MALTTGSAAETEGDARQDAAADDGRLRALVEAAPVLILQTGIDRRCEHVNAAWRDFTGRSRHQELGLGWTRAIRPDDYRRFLDVFGASQTAGLPFTTDLWLRRSDGAYRWMLCSGVPYQRDGRFGGFLLALLDVFAQAELRAGSGMDERQLRELIHRLKNCLQTCVCLSAIGRPLADPATQDDLSGMTERLSRLAVAHEQLIRYGGQRETAFGPYIEAVARSVHAAVANPHVRLEVACEPACLSTDRASAIGTVVDELVSAALTERFGEDRTGTVQVESRGLPGDRIEIAISDDGITEPEAVRPHASFQRQLVERLVAHARGTIRYELDGGTRCVITLDDV